MKGWLALLFILAGLIWVMPATAHADTANVQVNNLNVRSGPSLSDSVLGKVQKNESYSVVDKKGDWVKINWNNKTGWVANWLVQIKKDESVISKVDYLRVRSKGSLTAAVRGYLMKNEKVTKVSESGNWIKIDRSKGSSGWVHKDYLSTYNSEQSNNGNQSSNSSQTSLGKVNVATAVLNVRSKATTNSSILRQVRKGSSFEYLEEKQGWYKIKLDGSKTGWVAGWLVTKKNSSSSEPKADKETKVTMQYNATNLRSGPSTNYKVLGRANKGDQFNVISKEGKWYKISYKNSHAYVAGWIVDENNSTTPTPVSSSNLSGKTIVVDAGHGGFDPGAIGRSGTYEKTLTLQTAQKLKSTLERNGADVVMTRANDSYLSLSARTALSNASKGDAFISVHYNSVPQSIRATGINTYFYSSTTRKLASNVQSGVTQATGLRDRGIRHGDFHVIRYNKKPSIMVELGFISDASEEKTVKSSSYQNKASQGITNGLIQYFK
ncbi:putative N-acetylmuramoyl-L-alanine amidase YrvJ [Halobacillus andaensis]|uniref:N-acetylmuramoyl-L-alanine amidase YrvJ n=1 Tax=Halobacillus andaensis TaxID=1176239 RepID=A0A917AXL2_HALAA|nr:SH3 domain-containing protein [Halobacillus andaensis]MBP2002986.1 N-acetylmuramoyl-L-alanine amidase [Halobacillus andaensis]GGF07141.1 putative N-acetylmuramoyl-L-alanine amidase YrvJ [Halobacillus andaensis]